MRPVLKLAQTRYKYYADYLLEMEVIFYHFKNCSGPFCGYMGNNSSLLFFFFLVMSLRTFLLLSAIKPQTAAH